MLTNKYNEVFKVLYGYLNDESEYSPLVTKKAPLRPTTFPVVDIRGMEMPLDETTRREEWQNRLEITINIYAIEKVVDGRKVSGLEIIEELMNLIDKAMMEMHFTMTGNREIENADKNVDRHLLTYVAGVSGLNNKLIRRN